MLNQIDLSRTDLNLLVLFEAVLEERHVGRAAQRLNLTASAVSHGLGRLRRMLDDPLFLRTPKGVVPTARATALSEPIAEILTRVRGVIETAEPFDPSRSTRHFTIGAPDGISAVVLSSLLADLKETAPGIDISVVQLLPSATRVWTDALVELEARRMDIAVVPTEDIPVRFAARVLYEEDFVIASRVGHPFAKRPTLDRFCTAEHLVVSESGDPRGFVDDDLARQGRSRRVALTVPNFMYALSMIAESDLIGALPGEFVRLYRARFGVVATKPPLKLTGFRIRAVTPQVALRDAGLAWLFNRLVGPAASGRAERKARGS
jgi:DNA-binding transcriptional LysR family regulator